MRGRRALIAALAVALVAAPVAWAEGDEGPLAGTPLEHLGPGIDTQVGPAVPSTPTATTLYFHSAVPVGNADEVLEFAGAGGPPSMDGTAPTAPLPKVSAAVMPNPDFRKNPLSAYWGTPLAAAVIYPSHLKVWAAGPPGELVIAELFGDGGQGAATPIGTAEITLTGPKPAPYEVDIPGTTVVEEELVLEVAPSDAAVVLYDSADMPSQLTVNISEPVAGLTMVDPTGIALRAPDTPVVGSAGTGQIEAVDATGAPASALVTDLVVGHFTRGVQGVAVDAAGDVFYGLPDEGEVRFVRPDGTSGTYARGLGAVGGIAFDAAGVLYVVDQAASRVLAVAPDGSVTTLATVTSSPYGIAVDPGGSVVVSLPDAGEVDRISGTGSEVVFTELVTPEGIGFDATGNVLIVGEGEEGHVTAVELTTGTKTILDNLATGPFNLAVDTDGVWISAQCEVGACTDSVHKSSFANLPSITGFPAYRPVITPTTLPDLGTDAVAHHAGGVALDPSTVGPLPVTAMHYVGRGASEPTLGVNADGHIFYMAASIEDSIIKPIERAVTGLPRPLVLRSVDNGASWGDVTERIGGLDVPQTTGDPYLYVDPDTGRVFNDQLTLACSYLSFSDNEGETWSRNPIACGVPNDDHQTIAAGPPPAGGLQPIGYQNVVYYCVNQYAGATCSRSLDGGQTFIAAGVAFPAVDPEYLSVDPGGPTVSGDCSALTGHVWVGRDGTLYLPRGHCGVPTLAISHDEGVTWTRVKVSTTVRANQHEAVVRTDPSNNIYFTWIGTDRLPYFAISRDGGATWSTPKMVAPPAVTEVNLPTMAVGKDGSVVFGYQGTTATCCYTGGDFDKRDYGRTAWHGYITVTTDALSANPTFITTTANDRHDPLLRGACGPDRCQAPYNWDFDDAVIGPDGAPWVAFIDSCTGRCSTKEVGSNDFQGVAATFTAGPKLR